MKGNRIVMAVLWLSIVAGVSGEMRRLFAHSSKFGYEEIWHLHVQRIHAIKQFFHDFIVAADQEASCAVDQNVDHLRLR